VFNLKILIGTGGEVEILLVFKETEKLNKAQELYDYLKKKEIFKGNCGEVYSDISPKGNNVIILGLGEKEKISFESLRKAFYKLGKELMKFKVESAEVTVPKFENLCYTKTNMAIAEGLLQSEYAFEKYLSEKKIKPTVKEFFLNILEDKKDKVEEGIKEINNLIEGIFLARDLVNEPAMEMTPVELAKRAKEELEVLGVEVNIYDRDKIEELGMKAFLAVSKGSAIPPQFIVMKWNGDSSSEEKLALVGKGLTYDSGGYSIKPGDSMVNMYSDMGGSASVIGAMKAIAKSKLNKNVIGIIAACENLISGEAYKPGDVIGSMAGKTIEVWSTDAEGRLILADTIAYAAAKENVTRVLNKVKNASELAGEPVWQLPSNDEYRDLIKGTVGDLKNTGGRGGGTITAGLFLEEFVNKTPWVHLDIAGTAFLSGEMGYLPKGATGVPVKTLYHLAKEI